MFACLTTFSLQWPVRKRLLVIMKGTVTVCIILLVSGVTVSVCIHAVNNRKVLVRLNHEIMLCCIVNTLSRFFLIFLLCDFVSFACCLGGYLSEVRTCSARSLVANNGIHDSNFNLQSISRQSTPKCRDALLKENISRPCV